MIKIINLSGVNDYNYSYFYTSKSKIFSFEYNILN